MARILVVDDKAIFRDLISAALREAGYETTCASGGREALEVILSTSSPELVLLDLSMPEVDGLSVLRVLRTQKSGQKLPVILLTAASEKQTIVDVAKLGVNGYILKDKFSLADLLSRIEHVIGRPSAGAASTVTATAAVQSSAAAKSPITSVQTPSIPPANQSAASPATVAQQLPGTPSASSETDARADALAKMLGVPRLLTREQCIERAEKALQGKALSGVVAQVIQLVTSPRTEMAQIAESIGHDPMLTARVLRMANSAVYTTGRGPVTSISEAIKKMGFSTVRNIATTVGVFDAMPTASKDIFDPIRCWQHSFGVGVLCERFTADPEHPGAGAIPYLAGLCHDLGEILFQSCFGSEYKQVLEAQERTNHPVAQLAEAMLGVPPSELMLLTLRSLQLPDAIRLPIEAMHSEGSGKDRLSSVLRLADIYANGMQLAASPKARLRSFTKSECEQALGTASGPSLDRGLIRSEIFALTSLLTQADDPGVSKPMFPHTTAKVWLARETGLAKLDPVEAALESMARTQVSSRLPSAQEIVGFQGLVVSTQSACSGTLTAQSLSTLRTACQDRLPVLWLVQDSNAPSPQQFPNLPDPLSTPVALETVAGLLAA